MEGPSRIQTRIAEIEGRLAALARRAEPPAVRPMQATSVAPSAEATGTSAPQAFGAAYQQALDRQTLLGLSGLLDSGVDGTYGAGGLAGNTSTMVDSTLSASLGTTALGTTALGTRAPGNRALGNRALGNIGLRAQNGQTTDLFTTGVAGSTSGRGASSSIQVPLNLQVYGNGRIPPDALHSIGVGSHRLWGPAATAFQAMAYDAARDGVTIGVTDSYRGYDDQVDLAQRKGLYSQGGLGATPGTSPHGWGMALDLDVDAQGQAWLRANAGRYGFVEAVPREPWHWEYQVAG
jgi:zinc D-Ala-D-Ala carboxypeptidase